MSKKFVPAISSEKKVVFVGKMPEMPRADQELVDPYIGGHLPAGEMMEHLKRGAFRAGLVGALDGVYYQVVAGSSGRWAIVSLGRVQPANLITQIL